MAKRNKKEGANRNVSFGECEEVIHIIDREFLNRLISLVREEESGATKIPIDLAVARLEIVSDYLDRLNRVVESDDGREERILLTRKKVQSLRRDYKSRVEVIHTERKALKEGTARHHSQKGAPKHGYPGGGSSGSGRVFMTGGRTNPRAKR